MSERLQVCQALAAMVRQHGEPSEDEVRFVGHAAFELGLAPEENEAVQRVLQEGGDFGAAVAEITSRPMRQFFFRRVVAASLIDDQINDDEMSFIKGAGDSFGYSQEVIDSFIGWMREGIAWERRGGELLAKM